MQQCPKFPSCSAPFCPLDEDIEERVYLAGEPLCRIKPEDLAGILGSELECRYKKFIKICLQSGVKFRPWSKVKNELRSQSHFPQAISGQKK